MQLVAVYECLTFFFSVAVLLYLRLPDRAAGGGTTMNRVMTPRRGRQGEASRAAANAPTCPNTTRYDTRAALRRGAAPAEDDWVVAMVVRRRRTRRLTLVGDLPAAACKADMAVVRQASSGDAAGTIVSTSASQLVHCQHG